jgi:tetratricopeptide (TPR) repeat protein
MKVTAGLVLAGVLLFGPSFNDPFHFDDTLISSDSNVTNPARWAHFFNPFHLRQVTFFSFYLNHLVAGDDPAGYHLVNVGIHVANAVLFYWLIARFAEPWIAIASAGLFLVHPVQSEPVLYVYERSTLLACFFSLLALIALTRERRWLAFVLFLCAFESKEAAVAVPLVAVLLMKYSGHSQPKLGGAVCSKPARSAHLTNFRAVRWSIRSASRASIRWLRSFEQTTPPLRGTPPNLGGESVGQHIGDAVPYIAGAGFFAAAALGILAYRHEATVGIGAAAQIHPLRYLLTETRVVFTYLRLLVFPYPQSLEYDFQNAGSVLSAAGVVILLLAGWLLRRRVEGMCILVFFTLLAPTSSIIPSADAAFEHRLYLPMMAFAVLVAYGISRLRWRTPVAIPVFVVLALLTLRRETVWSSDIALWQDTVKHAPGKARVWFNLGGAYLSSDPETSRQALLHALELQPHFPEALYDLGSIEQARKNWDSAVAYYQRAIDQQMDYWPAWNNMGNTLFAMGRRDPALRCFDTTLRLNPDYWPAQYNIAVLEYLNGRYTEAVPRLRTVLDWQPAFREARYLLAESLTRSGNRRAADEEWQKLGAMNAAESRLTPTMISAPSRP